MIEQFAQMCSLASWWPPQQASMTGSGRTHKAHHAAAKRGAQLCLLFVLVCTRGALAGLYKITGETSMVGPRGDSGTPFNDKDLFMEQGPLTEIGFNSSLRADAAGLALWYGPQQTLHGTYVKQLISQKLTSGIVEVVVSWIEGDAKRKGRFTTFSFSNAEETYTFGMAYMNARSVTFKAPRGSYLAAVSGLVADNNLQKLKLYWGQQVTSVHLASAGVSGPFVVGPRQAATRFDDTAACLKGPDMTHLLAILGSGANAGMEVGYGSQMLSHGLPGKGANTKNVQGRITSIQGSYMPPSGSQPGSWCHFNFMGKNVNLQFGTPCTTGAKKINVKAPKGAWLGGFQGYATATELREVSFVWIKQQVDHNLL